jgi:branched-subunit amino acid ABC-type transport system permease component
VRPASSLALRGLLAEKTGRTNTVIFSILILILVFRPSGLLGEQTPEGQ